MKLGIMQPYFFPYLGYWQLINAVDKFVIYDDVNYIKGGWINRNRILLNGSAHYINMYMNGASSNKKINEIDLEKNIHMLNKNIKMLEAAYKDSPFFGKVFPLIKNVMYNLEANNIAEYIENIIREISIYLDISTEIIVSSNIKKNNYLKAQDKVIEICKILNADEYVNAIGGQSLYSKKAFSEEGIVLKFIKENDIVYKQYDNEFVRDLSIIDVLMFNSKEDVKKLLQEYNLI